jgi:hypothetical protein
VKPDDSISSAEVRGQTKWTSAAYENLTTSLSDAYNVVFQQQHYGKQKAMLSLSLRITTGT